VYVTSSVKNSILKICDRIKLMKIAALFLLEKENLHYIVSTLKKKKKHSIATNHKSNNLMVLDFLNYKLETELVQYFQALIKLPLLLANALSI